MARSRNLGVWTVAILGVSLLSVAPRHSAATDEAVAERPLPAAVGLVSRVFDLAVLPARAAGEVRGTGQAAAPRTVAMAAVLTVLAGLAAPRRQRAAAPGRASQTLRARRHAIALRAPPLRSV